MTKKVTAIPATRPIGSANTNLRHSKRRVAAYARVSTDMEEQASSYEAQINYYTSHIKSREDWIFAGMYSDEGISGTSTKHREGFQNMVTDALEGKIDLILTKSVSRFARNTVDSLTTVRQLKDAGVEVYFEKENIYTFDSKGEFLITIMSSLAQEESRSVSENVTWGHWKRFADGKIMVPYASLLGYRKGENGNLEIDQTQAPLVRRIYADYLSGLSPVKIAAALTSEQIPAPRGKTKWGSATIRSILTNEKYKGDALLQKSFTTDFLTKKTKLNEGEVPQYYVTGNHNGIIHPDVWELVQIEMQRRTKKGNSNIHPFASKIRCSQCGGWYGPKTWHAGSKNEKRIWRCNHKYEGAKTSCKTPHVVDADIEQAFVEALATRITGNVGARCALRILEETVLDTSILETERDKATQETGEITVLIDQLLASATNTRLDPDEFDNKYANLTARYEKATATRERLNAEITDKQARLAQARATADYLDARPPLEYTDDAWALLVDHVTIETDGQINVVFKGLPVE